MWSTLCYILPSITDFTAIMHWLYYYSDSIFIAQSANWQFHTIRKWHLPTLSFNVLSCKAYAYLPICLSIRTNAHPDVNKFPRIVILIAMSQSQMIDINLLHNLTTNYKRTHHCGKGGERAEIPFQSNTSNHLISAFKFTLSIPPWLNKWLTRFVFILSVDQLVRQWAPLVWLAPGEKYMPSSVTDFLHHVHAEKLKTPTKKKYPTKAGDQVEEDGTGGDGDDDDIGDRDNEHELYLLHQHQQQLSEKLTAQLMRQQQLKRERLHPVSANRRTSDSQAASSGIHLNPWERRNKRTYQDENMLVDYIIDMPVGENSENWNLVTNDDLGEYPWGVAALLLNWEGTLIPRFHDGPLKCVFNSSTDSLLEKPSSFIYGQSPSTGPVPIYAIISPCPSGGVGELPMRPQFQPHPLPSVGKKNL